MRSLRNIWPAGLLLLLAPQAAHASSCNNSVVQKIVFEKGKTCWSYSGKATHFEGRFSAGQKLTVKMQGELFEYNETTKGLDAKWAARIPSVLGPQRFQAEGDFEKAAGTLELVAPYAGIYRFGFYPCAMWHNEGQVQICASAPPVNSKLTAHQAPPIADPIALKPPSGAPRL